MRGLLTGIAAATGAAMLAATPASAATMLNVNWNADCGKATCFNENGVYSQTWSAKDALGGMTIGKFLMDRGVLGELDGQTFRITFSVGGQEIGTWGTYNMAGIGGELLNFDGADFEWNPEDGDLVLTLAITPPPKAGAGGGGSFSLVTDDIGGGFGEEEGGFPPLRGGPNGVPGGNSEEGDGGGPQNAIVESGVPEPATWALMISGFGMAGATMRQRRRIAARQPT